jgi:hypothetical protein
LISRPTTRKKTAMSPSLIQCVRSLEREYSPRDLANNRGLCRLFGETVHPLPDRSVGALQAASIRALSNPKPALTVVVVATLDSGWLLEVEAVATAGCRRRALQIGLARTVFTGKRTASSIRTGSSVGRVSR